MFSSPTLTPPPHPVLRRGVPQLRAAQTPGGPATLINSMEFAQRTISLAPNNHSILAVFGGHPNLTGTVIATITANLSDNLFHFNLEVNLSSTILQSVFYPKIVQLPALPGCTNTSDDTLVLPEADGSILVNPGGATVSRQSIYPGQASFQFTARTCTQNNGLFIATFDPDGHVKRWTLTTIASQRSVSGRLVWCNSPHTDVCALPCVTDPPPPSLTWLPYSN